MKEKINNDSCCLDCGNNRCCHEDWHGGKFAVLRWLLALLILAITLLIGFKLGEFKVWFSGDRYMPGYGMRAWPMYGSDIEGGGMMYKKVVPPPVSEQTNDWAKPTSKPTPTTKK